VELYNQYLERLKQFVSVELTNWQRNSPPPAPPPAEAPAETPAVTAAEATATVAVAAAATAAPIAEGEEERASSTVSAASSVTEKLLWLGASARGAPPTDGLEWLFERVGGTFSFLSNRMWIEKKSLMDPTIEWENGTPFFKHKYFDVCQSVSAKQAPLLFWLFDREMDNPAFVAKLRVRGRSRLRSRAPSKLLMINYKIIFFDFGSVILKCSLASTCWELFRLSNMIKRSTFCSILVCCQVPCINSKEQGLHFQLCPVSSAWLT
jgi:hypothetical protein